MTGSDASSSSLLPRLHSLPTAVALARTTLRSQASKPHQSASTRARRRFLQAMALLSEDGEFYLGAGMAWLVSALAAVEIVSGWIRGHRLRSKLLYLVVLVYGMRVGRQALKLRTFLANIPESRRFRCPAPAGLPSASAGECVLMEGACIQHLLRVATSSFHLMMLVVVLVICKKSRPRRPRVPGWGGVGATLFEILLFVLCIMNCAYTFPDLVLDYVAATANRVLDQNT